MGVSDFDVAAIADRLNRHHQEAKRDMRQLIRAFAAGMVVDEASLARGLAPELSRVVATRHR